MSLNAGVEKRGGLVNKVASLKVGGDGRGEFEKGEDSWKGLLGETVKGDDSWNGRLGEDIKGEDSGGKEGCGEAFRALESRNEGAEGRGGAVKGLGDCRIGAGARVPRL